MKTRFYILLSTVLLLLTQTSCVYDNDRPCGSEDPDLLVINLNLTVPSSSTGTRSAGDDLVPGNKDEDYINITDNDYQVLMFDKYGALVEGKLSEFECKENGVNGGMPSYTLTTKLSLSGNEDKERLSKFRVMVLANWESFENSNTKIGYTYPTFTGYNITANAGKNIFKDGDNFNFTFKELSDNSSWKPSIDEKQAIPMFGITDEVDLQFAMDMAKYGDGPSFSVPMLRSIAQIEVINKTPEEDNITISSCKLTAFNSTGRFIPDILDEENIDWNVPGKQISTVSLPTDYDINGQLDGEELLFVSLDGGKTFVVYIPEMDLDKIKEGKGAEAIPQVELMVTANGNEYGPYSIDLGEYDGEFTEKYYPALLRNHKYTFNIKRVSIGVTGELTLLIDTDDWDNDEDEYYYDDLAAEFSSNGTFKWNWDYDNIDSQDPVFTELLSDVTYDDVLGWSKEELQSWRGHNLIVQHSGESRAEASFTLTKPERGAWTLALYCEEGTPNHWFQIEIWDEDKGEWIMQDQRIDDSEHNVIADTLSGSIAGKGETSSEVKIRISATNLQYSGNVYKARLIMNITTFDGRMAEIDLINSEMYPSNTPDSEKEYFYILQYPTATE